MRVPRNLSGDDLIRALEKLGYVPTRQTGSHIRLTTIQHGEHHLTIPLHRELRIGTISGILSDIAEHFNMTKEQVAERLFGT